VKHVEHDNFQILDEVGSSDHRALQLHVHNTQALVVRKVVQQNAKLAKALLPEYRDAIKLYVTDPQQAKDKILDLKQQVTRPKKVKLKSYFEAIEFSDEEQKDLLLQQKRVKKEQAARYKFLLKDMERMRTKEARHFFRTIGNILNLYGTDPSVQCLADPNDEEKILVNADRINHIIGEHFKEHFADANRRLPDPAAIGIAADNNGVRNNDDNDFTISADEVGSIIRSVK
jgi:hypothetical protein